MLSFAIPGTVIGVSYILAFNVPPIEITGTACDPRDLLRVPQHAGRRARRHRGAEPDRQEPRRGLAHARRALAPRTLRRVVLPLLRPAIVAALVYSFVRAMTAVSAVIFLVTAEYNLATAYIVGRVEAGEFGLAIAYSSVLIVVMLVGDRSLIQFGVGERRLGRRRRATSRCRRRGSDDDQKRDARRRRVRARHQALRRA